MTTWAFVDFENVPSLGRVDLKPYSKVIVFLGAQQTKLDLGEKRYGQPFDLRIIQIGATKANNLDFHLSFYLGLYHGEAPRDIVFHVISNDKGFSELINHIRVNGRDCQQIETGINTSTKPATVDPFAEHLISLSNRPQKVASLRNYINSYLKLKNNDVAIQNQVNRLVNAQVLKVAGKAVEYTC